MPVGERPFRTVVDKMGMGDPIEAYNVSAERVTHNLYSAFGIFCAPFVPGCVVLTRQTTSMTV